MAADPHPDASQRAHRMGLSPGARPALPGPNPARSESGSRHATLFRRGVRIWSAPVGIGKPSTPTPRGHFWIREKFRTGEPAGSYGPVAFGSSNYSVLSDWPGGGVIGIHGTAEPSLIPGRPSHGCIRVRSVLSGASGG